MNEPTPSTPSGPGAATLMLRGLVAAALGVVLIAGGWLGYAYAFSPRAIRQPASAHYHFRLQIIDNGTSVNFADTKYQTPFDKDICTAALTKEPIHFHDHLDQFVHVHWARITGGLLLKNYGWNFIGGPNDTLGYRFDQLPHLTRIPAHGAALPKVPSNARYYVYTGSRDGYQERKWNDFITQDLRDFFAAKKTSLAPLEWLIPAASAHGDDEKLTQLNDVLGSVVIFAQKDRPTAAQIQDRFNHLVPLPESSCGG
ncbi:MAG: hypothetical protein JWN01_177 [Patescibacteria group bacterium]|nr:hypothetical protein [Patescibacteria group bacterium]